MAPKGIPVAAGFEMAMQVKHTSGVVTKEKMRPGTQRHDVETCMSGREPKADHCFRTTTTTDDHDDHDEHDDHEHDDHEHDDHDHRDTKTVRRLEQRRTLRAATKATDPLASKSAFASLGTRLWQLW